VNLRARLVPYLLLGLITLGAGLGVGLGLSEAPVMHPVRITGEVITGSSTSCVATASSTICRHYFGKPVRTH
jgi:hypothetical protein